MSTALRRLVPWLFAALILAVLAPSVLAFAQDALPAAPDLTDAAAPAAETGKVSTPIWVLIGVGMIVVGVLRAVRHAGFHTIVFLGGMAFVFIGERLFGTGTGRWPLTGMGVVAVLATLASRGQALASEKDPARRKAQRAGLIWASVATASLLLYALTTDTVIEGLGLDEDTESRWTGTWTALFPIVWLLGTLPMFQVDRALAFHPIALPRRAAEQAAQSGIATALALAMVFPLNYLAVEHKWEYDYAYFRTTDPGTTTLALVRELPEPVVAYLFYPAGSDVREELVPYFDKLTAASEGLFSYEVVDQALVPELAEKLKIRENGHIALVRGENNQKFKVTDDLDKAKRDLKKLDSTVQKNLLELAKGQRVAYLLTGHNEASPREKDVPLRKLNLFKKLLESQNFKVENLGVTEGSASAVPEDAAVVIVPGPIDPLMPEETRTLQAYVDGGGRLMVLVDPGGAPLTDLLAHLGVQAHTAPLLHASTYIVESRGVTDQGNLVTNRFGSHEAVTTLSRNSTQLALVTPTVLALEKSATAPGKVTTLVRTFPDTWEDLDGDWEKDAEEQGKVHEIALAIEGPTGTTWRAVVVGDVNALADPVLQFSQGNQVFAADTVRWLVGEESLVGETESEEDVKIQHTRDEDVAWFWATIAGIPLAVLLVGLVFVGQRRRRGK